MPIVLEPGVSVGGGVKISGAPTPALYTQLDTIASYLRNYMSSYWNNDYYEYSLDGDQYYIQDGGFDIFDGGNYTAPYLISGTTYLNDNSMPTPPTLGYSTTTATVTDTDFYYVSLGYGTSPDRRPLTMIGTRSGVGNPIGFQRAGLLGIDDPTGSISNGTVTSAFGNTLFGLTTYAFFSQTYNGRNAGSFIPAQSALYMLFGYPDWDSSFGDIGYSTTTNYKVNQGSLMYTYGANVKNILAVTVLLAKQRLEGAISNFDHYNVVAAYAQRIAQSMGIYNTL